MRTAGAVTTALILLLAATSVAAQSNPTPTLRDLAFMAGCWRGDFDDGTSLEEFYTMPSDNLILGTSRFMRGTHAVQFEFSRITADSMGIVLLPAPNGRPSEHAFRLTTLTEHSALFEAPEHDFPRRIRYTIDDGGTLTARIDGGDGDTRVQEWAMRPVPCRINR